MIRTMLAYSLCRCTAQNLCSYSESFNCTWRTVDCGLLRLTVHLRRIFKYSAPPQNRIRNVRFSLRVSSMIAYVRSSRASRLATPIELSIRRVTMSRLGSTMVSVQPKRGSNNSTDSFVAFWLCSLHRALEKISSYKFSYI